MAWMIKSGMKNTNIAKFECSALQKYPFLNGEVSHQTSRYFITKFVME